MKIEKGTAKNMEFVGYHDIEDKPGFQMAMQVVNKRWYLYIAHWYHQGWSIMDVTEPSAPKYIKFIPEPGGKPATFTIKVQVANGIMITQMQQRISVFFGNSPETPFDEGIYIWDVKDPENPRRLGHWKTGAGGTHRNYYDGGRYVHLSAACPGFSGNIYRIVDIADPTHPTEAGRWWLPRQWVAGGVEDAPLGVAHLGRYFLHGPPYPKGDKVYLSYHGLGMVILDISDITLPKFVGKLETTPPWAGNPPPAIRSYPLQSVNLH